MEPVIFKPTQTLLRLLEGLSDDEKEKVEKAVKDHVRACLRNGFQPETMERVVIEAVEIVRMENRFPEPEPEPRPVGEWPAITYHVYTTPKET
jgi:hypothetical protein